jgi:hypothetical protein
MEDPRRIEDLAAQILDYLVADPDRLYRFFDLTGLDPTGLRKAAAEPGFAASLLEYLGSDDRLFLGFARERNYDPAEMEALRQNLSARTDGVGM